MSSPVAPAPETYWHLWTDSDGISRQQRCTISAFNLGRLGERNAPQFSRDLMKEGNAFVTYLHVGWDSGMKTLSRSGFMCCEVPGR